MATVIKTSVGNDANQTEESPDGEDLFKFTILRVADEISIKISLMYNSYKKSQFLAKKVSIFLETVTTGEVTVVYLARFIDKSTPNTRTTSQLKYSKFEICVWCSRASQNVVIFQKFDYLKIGHPSIALK